MTLFLFTIAALLGAAPDEIIVRGKRPGSKAPKGDQSGHSVVVKPQKSLEKAQSMGEALAKHPGIEFKTTGGVGHLSMVLLRGSSPSQVSWFLDGFRLGGGAGGTLDVSQLPMAGVKKIQVFKSAVPMELGLEGIGGAVNIVPRVPKRTTMAIFHTLGSFATQRSSFFLGSGGAFPFALSGTWLTTLGNYRYFYDNGTEYTRQDDGHRIRTNNRAERLRLMGVTRIRLGGQKVSLYGLYLRNENGVPGPGSLLTTLTRYSYQRAALMGKTRGGHGGLSWEGGGGVDLMSDHYEDPLGELGIGTANDRSLLVRGEAHGRLRYRLGAHRIALAPRLLWERYSFEKSMGERSQTKTRGRLTVGARYRYKGRRFFAQGALSGVALNDGAFYPGARVGATYKLAPWARISANGTLSLRIPSFMEMYGDTGALKGNDGLRPERSRAVDAGFDLRGALKQLRFSLSGALFGRSVEDLIQYIPNSQFVASAQNIAHGTLMGGELSLAARYRRMARLGLAYTFTSTENHSQVLYQEGKELPGRPSHALHVALSGGVKLWGLRIIPGYTLTGQWGGVFDSAGRRPMPSRVFHSLGLSVKSLRAPVKLSVVFKNIGSPTYEMVRRLPETMDNQRYPQAVSNYLGYPIPGYSWYVTLSTKL